MYIKHLSLPSTETFGVIWKRLQGLFTDMTTKRALTFLLSDHGSFFVVTCEKWTSPKANQSNFLENVFHIMEATLWRNDFASGGSILFSVSSSFLGRHSNTWKACSSLKKSDLPLKDGWLFLHFLLKLAICSCKWCFVGACLPRALLSAYLRAHLVWCQSILFWLVKMFQFTTENCTN